MQKDTVFHQHATPAESNVLSSHSAYLRCAQSIQKPFKIVQPCQGKKVLHQNQQNVEDKPSKIKHHRRWNRGQHTQQPSDATMPSREREMKSRAWSSSGNCNRVRIVLVDVFVFALTASFVYSLKSAICLSNCCISSCSFHLLFACCTHCSTCFLNCVLSVCTLYACCNDVNASTMEGEAEHKEEEEAHENRHERTRGIDGRSEGEDERRNGISNGRQWERQAVRPHTYANLNSISPHCSICLLFHCACVFVSLPAWSFCSRPVHKCALHHHQHWYSSTEIKEESGETNVDRNAGRTADEGDRWQREERQKRGTRTSEHIQTTGPTN